MTTTDGGGGGGGGGADVRSADRAGPDATVRGDLASNLGVSRAIRRPVSRGLSERLDEYPGPAQLRSMRLETGHQGGTAGAL